MHCDRRSGARFEAEQQPLETVLTGKTMWPTIARLSHTLADAGPTREERLKVALARFEALPPRLRAELYKKLKTLSIDLLELLPLIISAQEAAGLADGNAGGPSGSDNSPR
jgi:hypothetical protein